MALVQEPEPGRKLLLEYGGRSIWEAQQLSLAGLGGFTRDWRGWRRKHGLPGIAGNSRGREVNENNKGKREAL
jgi:hypothetical protein